MNKTLAIDFDNVLHKASHGFDGGKIYDEPTENAVFTLNNLADKGYKLIVFTSRDKDDWPNVTKWLDKWGFPQMEITNIKPKDVLAIIDNRAIRFTRWSDIVYYFL